MAELPANPTDPALPPRKRRFFQFHLSTAIILMFVAGGLVWFNLARRNETDLVEKCLKCLDLPAGTAFDCVLTVGWGWPLPSGSHVIHLRYAETITFIQRSIDVSATCLLINVAAGIIVLLGAAVISEELVTTSASAPAPRRFGLHLSTWLLAALVAAFALTLNCVGSRSEFAITSPIYEASVRMYERGGFPGRYVDHDTWISSERLAGRPGERIGSPGFPQIYYDVNPRTVNFVLCAFLVAGSAATVEYLLRRRERRHE